jgi:L-threonylcarbamoyladenylate synthase
MTHPTPKITRHLNALLPNHDGDIRCAAEIIRGGGLVGLPTETVYGLAANALDPAAIRAIYEAKGRPHDNPVIVHVAASDDIGPLCTEIPDAAKKLMAEFWPGPLTLILRRAAAVPGEVSAGLDTIAVRCPDHAVARQVITLAGVPIAAPSANPSGHPSPTCARHVMADMDGKIDAVLDGGPCLVGLESTVVDMTATPPRILRPGGVTAEQLRACLGEVIVDPDVSRLVRHDKPVPSPGMKYRHYAPCAPVILLRGAAEDAAGYLRTTAAMDASGLPDAAVLCFDDERPFFEGAVGSVASYGPSNCMDTMARRLFYVLRSLDKPGVSCIYARCPEGDGLAAAIRNRLQRAAGFTEVQV